MPKLGWPVIYTAPLSAGIIRKRQEEYGNMAPSVFAFQNQVDCKGFSMVEVLSMCPTNWGTRLDNPSEATKFVNDNMMKVFPLGVYKGA